MRKSLLAVGLSVAVVLASASAVLADLGPDDSFSGDGLVIWGRSGQQDWLYDVVAVDDGYVAVGTFDRSKVGIAKFHRNGTLDRAGGSGRPIIELHTVAWRIVEWQFPT